MDSRLNTLRKIKRLTLIFIILLAVVGFSVFPIVQILEALNPFLASNFPQSPLTLFFNSVANALAYDQTHYPFMLYGLDWLGYAHLMIALVFIGPLRDPVKNIWVIEFGILACLLTLPAIFIFGYKNQIPLWWSFIDCTFGVIGAILLNYIRNLTLRISAA